MWILSLIAFLVLGGYLLLCAMRFGVPDMVSDTFYQLQGTTGSTIIGSDRKRNFGWLFSVVMVATAILMMMAILDTGKGVQCLAFIGCAGLAFVGCAPNYLNKDDYKIHKTAAIVAAVGCVGWCLSVYPIVTVSIIVWFFILGLAFGLFDPLFLCSVGRGDLSNSHIWYWAEVSAFLDVFVTYWMI